MDITYRFLGDLTVLGLSGRLTASAGETEMLPIRTAFGDLIAKGRVRIALNLSAVTHLDARGLAELVLTHTVLRRCGGQLTLVAASPRVMQMLSVTRLDTVFRQCASEHEALETGREPGDDTRCHSAWLADGVL